MTKLTRRKMLQVSGASLFLSQMMQGSRNAWGQTPGARTAYALHIGVDQVDHRAYSKKGLRLKPLKGCVKDALAYAQITRGTDQFKVILLKNDAATTGNVYGHLVWAAQDLKAGDLMVVSYAGHGGSVPDTSRDESRDPINDRRDETWCLYDRQLLDDELGVIWGQFQPGVRILLLSDSCHSGTVARAAAAARGLKAALEDGNKTEAREAILGKDDGATLQSVRALADPESEAVQSRGADDEGELVFRSFPEDRLEDAYLAQKDTYDEINARLRGIGDARAEGMIQANGLLLAACQDDQLSAEVNQRGVFTATLEKVLAEQPDNYRVLLARTAGRVSSLFGDQVPQFYRFGTYSDEFYDQKPFQVA